MQAWRLARSCGLERRTRLRACGTSSSFVTRACPPLGTPKPSWNRSNGSAQSTRRTVCLFYTQRPTSITATRARRHARPSSNSYERHVLTFSGRLCVRERGIARDDGSRSGAGHAPRRARRQTQHGGLDHRRGRQLGVGPLARHRGRSPSNMERAGRTIALVSGLVALAISTRSARETPGWARDTLPICRTTCSDSSR